MAEAAPALERILITTAGSRGDVQPYIVVALKLREAGYTVLIATNVNNEDFVRSFGLQFHAVYEDCEKLLGEKGMLKSMETGNLADFVRGAKRSKEKEREILVAWKAALDAFQPHLIIGGTFSQHALQLSSRRLNIPTLALDLHGLALYIDPKRMLYGMTTIPMGLNGWFLKKVAVPATYKMLKQIDDEAEEIFGVRAYPKRISMKTLHKRLYYPQTPHIIASGPVYGKVLYDHLPEKQNVRFTGSLVLDREAQVQNAKEAKSNFGQESTMEAVEAFLAEGSKPVYMGWGSMTVRSPEFMMRLVLEALRLSGLRAIILAGWAKLSVQVLDPSQDDALIKYAEQNVLVIASVPHEWLLPQCACSVHHGGAGTTTAALRAGVPTIITPCFMDQFDFAYVVNKLGIGVGLQQFSKIKAKDLAGALQKCTTDSLIAMRATEVAAQIRQENGAQGVLREVEAFWRDWVQTGRYAKVLAQEADEDEAAPRKGCIAGCSRGGRAAA